MISVILYGRNDSYGYNLHKRAALSLNCIAEILTHADDEILFVDYNTPDDYPTFPEAIQDTLTDHAKKLLRILRVRPSIHERFKNHTHLLALEPVARNVAVRRSKAANRWILSTNTDMIFTMRQQGTSLSESVKDLPKGFYHLPRFEIPETLWETFDRKNPQETIATLQYWGEKAHLNEIVLGISFNRFDGPGDFQLMERDDLIKVRGFDERMLLGWHVDSNIAKRLNLLYGKTSDLLDCVFGYHCDHTRQITPAHQSKSVTNDVKEFIDDIDSPDCQTQAEDWGCANDFIEEINLNCTRNQLYLESIKSVIKNNMATPTTAVYAPESFNTVPYDPPHVLPFLADIFVNAPQGIKLAWIGGNAEMFHLFSEIWAKMGFGGPIYVCNRLQPFLEQNLTTAHKITPFELMADEADAFIFDNSIGNSTEPASHLSVTALADIRNAFYKLVNHEQNRIAEGVTPRRFVVVNAIHNHFEPITERYLSVARTPFSSRIRQGFVICRGKSKHGLKNPENWIADMCVGSAGVKVGSEFWAEKLSKGHVIYGPYLWLPTGKYSVQVGIKSSTSNGLRFWKTKRPTAKIEIVAGEKQFARSNLCEDDLFQGLVSLDFELSDEDIIMSNAPGLEVRVWTSGKTKFGVSSVEVQPRS